MGSARNSKFLRCVSDSHSLRVDGRLNDFADRAAPQLSPHPPGAVGVGALPERPQSACCPAFRVRSYLEGYDVPGFAAGLAHGSDRQYLGLSELSCLQHLTLTFFADEIRFIDTAVRSMKAEEIRKISVIHFTIDWTREASLEWYENLKADRILAQPQFIPLERVHWTVLTRDRQDTHEGWRAGVGRCFPELCRRKLLCLYVSDSTSWSPLFLCADYNDALF